jgi:hypothetical protein
MIGRSLNVCVAISALQLHIRASSSTGRELLPCYVTRQGGLRFTPIDRWAREAVTVIVGRDCR